MAKRACAVQLIEGPVTSRTDPDTMDDRGMPLYCPSARPELTDGVIFGVVTGTATEPMVRYLNQQLPITADTLAQCAPVEPTEVLRFAAPCARHRCLHFDGAECGLARRTVQLVQVAVPTMPRCAIRPNCLWFAQEGRLACLRCPSVVTDNYAPSGEHRLAADPKTPRVESSHAENS